jgi:hypothetical protein
MAGAIPLHCSILLHHCVRARKEKGVRLSEQGSEGVKVNGGRIGACQRNHLLASTIFPAPQVCTNTPIVLTRSPFTRPLFASSIPRFTIDGIEQKPFCLYTISPSAQERKKNPLQDSKNSIPKPSSKKRTKKDTITTPHLPFPYPYH